MRTLEPGDLPFEQAQPEVQLAPDTVKARQRRVRGPKPEAQRRGRNNRARGAEAERRLERLFLDHGWLYYRQGGVGRRDSIAIKGERRLSIECKSITGHREPPKALLRDAFAQALRQAREGEEPLACVWAAVERQRGSWTFQTTDGAMPAAVWFVMQEGEIVLP